MSDGCDQVAKKKRKSNDAVASKIVDKTAIKRNRIYRERHRDEINRRRRENRRRKRELLQINSLSQYSSEMELLTQKNSSVKRKGNTERQKRYYERHKVEINERKRHNRRKQNLSGHNRDDKKHTKVTPSESHTLTSCVPDKKNKMKATPDSDASASCVTEEIYKMKILPMIVKVYLYLEKEYEYVKSLNGSYCDLSPLADILRRTSEATGVTETDIIELFDRENLSDHLPLRAGSIRRKITQNYREDDCLMAGDIEDEEMQPEVIDDSIVKLEIIENEILNYEETPSCSNIDPLSSEPEQVLVKMEPEEHVWTPSDRTLYLEVSPLISTSGSTHSSGTWDSAQTQVKSEPDEDGVSISGNNLLKEKSGSTHSSGTWDSAQTQVKSEPDEDGVSISGNNLLKEKTAYNQNCLPSRSNVLTEAYDATSTSATPSAETPKISAPKSSAQRQREYRQRKAASRTPAQLIATRISDAERKRNYRLRKAAKLALASDSLESTTTSSFRSAGSSKTVQNSTQRQLTNQQLQSLAVESAQTSVQLGTSAYLIEVPVEPMGLTDLPLPSSCNAMSFAEPQSKPKSSAQRQREYRQRMAASRTPAEKITTKKLRNERQRNSRLRKAANSFLVSDSRSNDVETDTQTHQQGQTSAAEPAQITVHPGTPGQIEVQLAQSTWFKKWVSSIIRFQSTFLNNDFGYACSVCDRLWCKNDLKPITLAQMEVISEWFIKKDLKLCREEYEMVCNSCKRSLNKKTMPLLAKVNGFSYPDQPSGLPPLDPISERLISPLLPFMQIRRLRHDFSYGIIGQVINVPVDVQEMVKYLPRQLNEDDDINLNIKRNLAHKSVYTSEYMSKSTISAWLTVLQNSTLYRLYEINVDLSRLHCNVPFLNDIQDDPSDRIENISTENTPESEILDSRQHTMIWNEKDCHIALGQQATLRNIVYYRHAEELSFPSIYFGEPRQFNPGVSVSPYMIATSEIRRRDRRGATPQKIFYVAMKLLRLRMADGIDSTFRNISALEDKEFMKEYVIQNLAFMKTVPNSVQYWASRKQDLFAMIRQLGKPTVFLTISANEIRWMPLLTILLKLSNKYPGKTARELNASERCTLVSDDPVTCCIYFYKLVDSLMKMLKSRQCYNPFGKYFVKDYFLRIEFQHQGSPQAHVLLWLNDDPCETVSEIMPRTIDLVEKLSSVARDDVPNNSVYDNQIHKHTFSCTKDGETTCRFGIPYWPMSTTRVLVPIPQSDGRHQTLKQKAKELRTSLSECRYTCMDEFLNANDLKYVFYLDIVRSTLRKPTLLFRRNFDQLMTNTFNPYLAGEVNSNINIQFILDEESCAEYIEEYINKPVRGMSNLRRELTTIMQEHPDQDYTGQLKALSNKVLDAFEMSAQEAAWYLLRQPMSETSRPVVYIPTVLPIERQNRRKRRQQMDREGIDVDSSDVWIKNIIQRYEERPGYLEQVYLAEFASWYAKANDFVDEDDAQVDDDEDSETVPEAITCRPLKQYSRRRFGRIIRYRRYDKETCDYKREMVLLYVQFRNEMSDILDQNKFLKLFDDNKDTIIERRSLFETNLYFENGT